MAITDPISVVAPTAKDGTNIIRQNLAGMINVMDRSLIAIKAEVDRWGAAAIQAELELGETGDDADMRTTYNAVRDVLQDPCIGKTVPVLPT